MLSLRTSLIFTFLFLSLSAKAVVIQTAAGHNATITAQTPDIINSASKIYRFYVDISQASPISRAGAFILYPNGNQYSFSSAGIYSGSYQIEVYASGFIGDFVIQANSDYAQDLVEVARYTYDGTSMTIAGKRDVSYNVDIINTSVSPQTITVDIGGTIAATQSIEPFSIATISGVASATDGSLCTVTATDALHSQNGLPYDPFFVSAANTNFNRAYYVGPAPTEMVDITVVVQANNISTMDSWVRAFAGSMKVGEITTAGGDSGEYFVFLKVTMPVAIGTVISMSTQGNNYISQAPKSTTAAANNTTFHWIVTVTGPAYRDPFDSEYTDNISTTNYGDGQVVVQSPTATGTNTTLVNTTNLPNKGQTVTVPPTITGNGTGIQTTPGSTIITGSGPNGSNGNTLADSAALIGILANTAQIAQNTGQNNTSDGLVSEMPDESALTRFTPDSATVNALSGMNPLLNLQIPTGVAPEITLPFGELGIEGLANQSISFSNTNLLTWAGIIRTFLLFCISALFIFHHIRIISKALSTI